MDCFLSIQIGFLASVPYIGRFTFAQISSAVADHYITKPNVISKLNLRKAAYSVSLLGPATGLAVLSYTTSKWYFCIAVMTFGKL